MADRNRYVHTGPTGETTTQRAARLGFPEGTRVQWVGGQGDTFTGTVVTATRLGDMLRVRLHSGSFVGKFSPEQLTRLDDQHTEQPGERVELVSTTDAYTDLRPGERGTVVSVDDVGTLHVAWDNGSALGLVPGLDCWARVGA